MAVPEQTPPSMLFLRDLHGFLFPQPVDPFPIDRPASSSQLLVDTGTTEPRTTIGDATHIPN